MATSWLSEFWTHLTTQIPDDNTDSHADEQDAIVGVRRGNSIPAVTKNWTAFVLQQHQLVALELFSYCTLS